MTKLRITKSMLDQLDYDTQKMSLQFAAQTENATQLTTPTVMFVFAASDLNAATYHIAKSIETPFAANALATVLVQESVYEDFINKLQSQLPCYGADVINHKGHAQALELISRLKARTITATDEQSPCAATLVCDVTHEHLGPNATGLVTLHTFRTAKEAITLCNKETVKFCNASIWVENHAYAYEVIAAISCQNFYINCFEAPLEPLQQHAAKKEDFVTMDKSYHYETLTQGDQQKSIIFPIGSIFAN